ncbi:hypothetical protein J7T55_002229 [Diaporthe amygdali]|uniref:uncharacterized protein n=1 Tax=Phomopsis amygdali TaxID=1214568 RepID=UPI0022FEA4A2|nr:uncharacterized protein J7T55_002229 [Diaporthe amygdali]KAJ0109037.1 hypothetical protein J7T55_002229 [Diaporthe amygdali]
MNLLYIRSAFNRVVWSISKRVVLSSFPSVTSGALRIETTNGKTITLGQSPPTAPIPSITVHHDRFWVRVLIFGDIGFAQSYMRHEISSIDLTAVLEFFVNNSVVTKKPASAGLLPWLFGAVGWLILEKPTNDIKTSRFNAKEHYSKSNNIFRAFLSPDMTYSAPIWLPKKDPRSRVETLEDAQLRKLEYAVSQTRLRASDHVLEIGTGWGSFAIMAARKSGCRVTTVTLNDEQKLLAEERIMQAGLNDRVRVLKADYRELNGIGPFDKIVSIEMIEHVGHEFLGTFFECMDRYLKVHGGIGYFQCITIPETRYEQYCRSEDFIRRYMFPGGHLPTVSGLVANIDRGSRGKLIVEEIKSVGVNYPRALRSWKESFQANFEVKIVPALRESNPRMTVAEIDLFRRTWEYYFSYCEAGFKTKSLGNFAITVGRENCMAFLEDP